MSNLDDGSPVVEYSVKELLSAIRQDQAAGFADLRARLDGKADKSDVAALGARIDGHEGRIDHLEESERTRRDRSAVHQERDARALTRREKVVGLVSMLFVVAATIVGPVVAATIH